MTTGSLLCMLTSNFLAALAGRRAVDFLAALPLPEFVAGLVSMYRAHIEFEARSVSACHAPPLQCRSVGDGAQDGRTTDACSVSYTTDSPQILPRMRSGFVRYVGSLKNKSVPADASTQCPCSILHLVKVRRSPSNRRLIRRCKEILTLRPRCQPHLSLWKRS